MEDQHREVNFMQSMLSSVSPYGSELTATHSVEEAVKNFDDNEKKLTLKAVLFGRGALSCFAAAAFLPGGGEWYFI